MGLLDSTPRFQRMLTEDILSLSTWLMTLFQSSSQLKRTQVLLKDHSLREESTKMLIETTNSSHLPSCQLVVILRSMATTSMFLDVMNTQLNPSQLTHLSDY